MSNTNKLSKVLRTWRPNNAVIVHITISGSVSAMLSLVQLLDNGMVYFEYESQGEECSQVVDIDTFCETWDIDLKTIINTTPA